MNLLIAVVLTLSGLMVLWLLIKDILIYFTKGI
jgi:hypothetical protein